MNVEICTGQVYDRSTGLYYYNARFYDPEDGRFLTQDTYRGENTEPETWHLYTYCANDPINFIDQNGNKRGKKKNKNETLGWGLTIQASLGQIISSASIGLDIVWFNKNVDTRYKKKMTHAFWHIDADISAGLEKSFKKVLKKQNL